MTTRRHPVELRLPKKSGPGIGIEVKLATVDRELSKLRRLFNVAVGKGWLVRSPFTKEVSKELIQEGDETPSAMSIRELSDDEAQRVMTALNTPEHSPTVPLFIAALDTGARKSSLLDYLKWKLQLRLKHNNPDALVFEESKV